MEDPKTYARQLDYIRRRLTEQPAHQTFFVLDPATRQAEVRRADRLRREHERHRAPRRSSRRRPGDRQVPGIAPQPLRTLFAVPERGLSRHGHRAHHAHHGPVADLRLARQPAAGPRRAVPTERGRPRADQHAPGQRQRHGPGHAGGLRRAVGAEHPRAEAGRGGRHLDARAARRGAARGQGVARPRHGRLRRRLGARRARVDRGRQLLLRAHARDQRRRGGDRLSHASPAARRANSRRRRPAR